MSWPPAFPGLLCFGGDASLSCFFLQASATCYPCSVKPLVCLGVISLSLLPCLHPNTSICTCTWERPHPSWKVFLISPICLQHSTICTWEGPVETWWQVAIARFVAGQRGIPVHHMSSHVAIKCLSKCVLMPPCHFLHHIHSSFCCAPRDETRKSSSFCSILFVSASIDV